MAKKKKFKLSGQIKAQLLSQLTQSSNLPAQTTFALDKDEPNQSYDQKATIRSAIHPIHTHVLNDIKRIGFVVGVLTIILIAVTAVDARMQLSLTIGQKIARALGI